MSRVGAGGEPHHHVAGGWSRAGDPGRSRCAAPGAGSGKRTLRSGARYGRWAQPLPEWELEKPPFIRTYTDLTASASVTATLYELRRKQLSPSPTSATARCRRHHAYFLVLREIFPHGGFAGWPPNWVDDDAHEHCADGSASSFSRS